MQRRYAMTTGLKTKVGQSQLQEEDSKTENTNTRGWGVKGL